ncbi:MAG TPA: GNAT family N-acetyltransferase [Actinomycetota bacterium]|nr:GNAT family N-acetyltransferase [Actinomycetota bacterium]
MAPEEEILRAFDDDMRRTPPAGVEGVRIELDGRVRRAVGLDDTGWFAVEWSDLDESTAEEAIARQIERFAALGRSFEWKYYDYDRPADLEQRLVAAGFVAEEDESVMIGSVATLPRSDPPDGVRIIEVADEAGVDALIAVHDAAFGHPQPRYRETLLAQIRAGDRTNVLVVALAGETAVSAARLEMPPGRRFASLWGGGTVPDWRGRGIYRALVSYRAGIAAERGYEFLHVDASSQSRPILERLGFVRIARTTPYRYEIA